MSHIECVPVSNVFTPVEERDGFLYSQYLHQSTRVEVETEPVKVRALVDEQRWQIRTQVRVPRTGVLLAGIGGNNGTTLACALVANQRQVTWEDKHGTHRPDWLGSLAVMGTCKLGCTAQGRDVYVPIRSLLPMLHPNDLVVGGWDISKTVMSEAVRRAQVMPLDIQRQVAETLDRIPVWPGVHRPGFIATNQQVRADNVIAGTQATQLQQLRADILTFKNQNNLDKVFVVWTGNTERFVDHQPGYHDTADNFLQAIDNDYPEISPSSLYATAAILEGCSFINGSPQNVFCDGIVELAQRNKVFLIGDDLKTGQTKIKSVLVDFLVSTALKPTSIVSYNHLGNNDGLNLSSERQFKSKELTKASVVDDVIHSNSLLYPPGEKKPDHLIVIKYVPAVGDSKRALDEYTANIFMNGTQTIVLHNTCEDSLLAVPIIIDLLVFAELFERVEVLKPNTTEWTKLHTMLSLLSLFLKAPQVPKHAPVINALFAQREALISFIRAAAGLPPQDYLSLGHRV
eukprot:Gregarina_sp_Pseudo_9__3513@NODE_367_length_3026_cov_49_364915_g346_i0_p1_GENE_NODE_367_length_3026_cov_49_364915_g346_i0NODE_367_length_3026_cov_49_364915_g346_i0_p1_ORF_typecomplete_len515_score107_35NAD_binding_5/PF07994_12/6_9e154Inos1P_synth/PF01658_17/9_8e50_NODE_367_length_3026_cov_49_364915_g346_i013952939